MKKVIILTTLVLMSFSVACFAGVLEGAGGLVSLSTGVNGDYFVDADPATAFTMSTGHTQGNRAYATGSFSTNIHWKNGSGTDNLFIAADDLLGDPTNYNTATLEAWDDGVM